MKIVIIGGVAGGATAAARLRRNNEFAEIVLVERGPYISFANCGLPYHVSGEIPRREALLVTTEARFAARYAVEVRSLTEAVAIDTQARRVRLRNVSTGVETDETFDRLLLAPGAEPLRPPMPGVDDPRVFTLRNLPDLDRIMARLNTEGTRRAVVVGGGFIGIEVAENLHRRGLVTTLVEAGPQLMAPLDPEMAAMVEAQMRENRVGLLLEERVERFEPVEDQLTVRLASGRHLAADIVILAIGVRPEVRLARAAGLAIGPCGGIRVDAWLQTSDPAVWAVGDAVEVRQIVSGREALVPLAGPANRQARIAADNMSANDPAARKTYDGAQGTSILKVFSFAAASTGLNSAQLAAAGIEHRTCIIHAGSHASYYPGAMPLALKLCWAPADGRILGAQAVGAEGADKRIDVIAAAMRAGLGVNDLSTLELAYAPPFGSAKDPVNVAGDVAGNIQAGAVQVVEWSELRDLLADPARVPQLVDVRTPEEFAQGSIPGARNIELDQLRMRIGELDPARETVVFCQVGLRGYLAWRILHQRGLTKVRNLSGGFKTWALATTRHAQTDVLDFENIKHRDPDDIAAERALHAVEP